MVAQAKAAAMQNLSHLPCYTGEGADAADYGFVRWIECFHCCNSAMSYYDH